MKVIYASQRVEDVPSYAEHRDALDQNWARLFFQAGALLVALPNYPAAVKRLLKQNPPDGILLTGGNSPARYGGQAPERDETDDLLIAYCERANVPLLGVCRGMQSLILYYGGSLRKTAGHVAVRHQLLGMPSYSEVNSFHAYAVDRIPPVFEILGTAPDHSAEAVRHRHYPQLGILWHPERDAPFRVEDLNLLRNLFELEQDKR